MVYESYPSHARGDARLQHSALRRRASAAHFARVVLACDIWRALSRPVCTRMLCTERRIAFRDMS